MTAAKFASDDTFNPSFRVADHQWSPDPADEFYRFTCHGCRGSYRVYDTPQGSDRRPLYGTLDEIRDDIGRYADAGLTELFLEANFVPGVHLDAVLEVMARLAPSG